MTNLQTEFQSINQKFQLMEKEIARHVHTQECQKKLIEKLKRQVEAWDDLKKVVEKYQNDTEGGERESDQIFETKTCSENKETENELHSIKDRIKHLTFEKWGMSEKKHAAVLAERFIYYNKDLCSIGRQMADYYRKTYSGKDPAKKEEKINEKHNSLVCVYSEADWEYLDYLITTILKIQ